MATHCFSSLRETLGEHREGQFGQSDIFALPIAQVIQGQPLKPVAVVQTKEFIETDARFSPDGRWISYTASAGQDTRTGDVYVTAYPPGKGGKWQISTSGGSSARWRGDGKELFFVSPRSTMSATEVSSNGTEFNVGQVRELYAGLPFFTFVVPGNGQRFLAPINPGQPAAPTLTLVQNWAAGLKP